MPGLNVSSLSRDVSGVLRNGGPVKHPPHGDHCGSWQCRAGVVAALAIAIAIAIAVPAPVPAPVAVAIANARSGRADDAAHDPATREQPLSR